MEASNSVVYLRWIVLLPLLGAAINGIAGAWIQRRLGRTVVAFIAGVPIGASLLLTLSASAQLAEQPPVQRAVFDAGWTWIDTGDLRVDVSFWMDPLSAIIALLVVGIGSLVHVYSVGYLRSEPALWRYFAALSLFTGALLAFVLADNLLLLFAGWQGIGLCSYSLIGFWYREPTNVDAAFKAFVIDRIGDVGFLLAMSVLFWTAHAAGQPAVALHDISLHAGRLATATLFGWEATTVVALLLFAAVAAKSSQIPLHVWLPDAMVAPTPVSAWVHAVSMGAAGIFLIARLYPLFESAPSSASVIAWIGALTAFFAATIACARTDIKEVLAFSTISQLGLMVLALGVGAAGAAIFHLSVHALFATCLFLAAGVVMQRLGATRDLRRMGGLCRRLPRTHAVFFVGTLAVAALPPFSGFFSKGEILWRVLASDGGGAALWGLSLVTAGLTSFYAFRALILVFYGDSRVEPHLREKLHEAEPIMTVPLLIVAACAALVGLVGLPIALGGGNLIAAWLASGGAVDGGVALPNFAGESLAMLVLTAFSAGGLGVAHAVYFSHRLSTEWFTSFAGGRVAHWVSRGYYVDTLYRRVFVSAARALSGSVAAFDARIVEHSAVVVAAIGRGVARIGDGFDRHFIVGVPNVFATLAYGFGGALLRLQTGQVSFYVALAVVLVVAALLLRML